MCLRSSSRIRLTAMVVAIGLSLFTAKSVSAQRLCEHNDNPVAKIAPCTGPAGTAITVTRVRTSVPAARSLVFKRMVANATPAKVTVPVSNGKATAPQQLCINGPGRWEVWLVDGNGLDQGKIGAFWPECPDSTGGASGGGSGGGNAGTGAGGPGGGPVGGGGGGGAGTIDKCLVGTWVSGPVGGKMSGGKGMKLTFAQNGSHTADYTNMEVLRLNTMEYQFGGISRGTVRTSNGSARFTAADGDSTLSIRIDGQGGPAKSSPGPGLGRNKNDNSYRCDRNGLTFVQEDFAGNAWFNVSMKRTQ